MLNIKEFATIVITNAAVRQAKEFPSFSWKSFPDYAVGWAMGLWVMAGRSMKVWGQPRNKAMVLEIAKRIAKDFSEITGKE